MTFLVMTAVTAYAGVQHVKNSNLAETNLQQAADIGSLTLANEAKSSTISELERQLALNEQLAIEQVAKTEVIANATNEIKESLDIEVKEGKNEQIVNWVDEPLPDFVVGMLKQAENSFANGNHKVSAASTINAVDGHPEIFRQNQSGLG